MKKNLLLILFVSLFLFTNEVDAKAYNKSSIPYNSYLIGTYLYTTDKNDLYDTSSSSGKIYDETKGMMTPAIMIGATSIADGKYSKMVIYYKDFDNNWYDALDGDRLSVPTTINITHINGICIDDSCKGTQKNVSFYLNDGIATSPKTVNVGVGSVIPAEAIPNVNAPIGAELNYWSQKGSNTRFDFTTKITTDLSLEANWKYFNYKISYIDVLNNNATKEVNCTFGTSSPCEYGDYEELFTDIPIGYTFVGWSDKTAGGTVYTDLESMRSLFKNQNSNITLYAIFESEDYLVNYKLDGAKLPSGVEPSFKYDSSVTIYNNLATPTKDGYVFNGWKVEGQKTTPNTSTDNYVSNNVLYINTPSKINLVGEWTPIQYFVEYTNENSFIDGGESVSIKCTYDQVCNLSAINQTLVSHKLLLYWTATNQNGESYKIYDTFKNLTVVNNEEVVIEPVLEDVKYSITYDYNNGKVNGFNPTSIEFGETIDLFPPAKSGYNFTNYTATVNGSSFTVTDSLTLSNAGNVTLKANYSVKNYTVSFNFNEGEGNPSTFSRLNCTISSCTLPSATPTKNGYDFDGWNYNGMIYTPGSQVILDVANGTNIVLVAKWTNKDKYEITYNLQGGTFEGAVSTFLNGEIVTLSEPSRPGYRFLGWHDGNTIVTNTSGKFDDFEVTARWEAINYDVRMYKSTDGGEFFTETCAYDSACDLSFTPNTYFEDTYPDYNFLGWALEEDGNLFYGNGVSVKNLTTSSDTVVELYPVLQQKESSILYLLEGGTIDDAVELVTRYVPGETISLPVPTREGYTFTGWVLSDDESFNIINDSLDTDTLSLSGDIALVAMWSGQSYAVNYHYITRNGYESYTTTCNYGSTCVVNSVDNSDSIYKDWTYVGPGDSGIIPATEGDNYNFDYIDGFDSLDLYMTEATAVTKTIEYNDFDDREIDALDIGYSVPVSYSTDSIYVRLDGLYAYSRDNSISSWIASGSSTVILVTEDDGNKEFYLITDGSNISLTADMGPATSTNAQLTFYNLDGNKILYGVDDYETVPLNDAGKLNVDSTYADNDIPQIDGRAVFVFPWYINGFKVDFDELVVYPSSFLNLYLGYESTLEEQPTHFD